MWGLLGVAGLDVRSCLLGSLALFVRGVEQGTLLS